MRTPKVGVDLALRKGGIAFIDPTGQAVVGSFDIGSGTTKLSVPQFIQRYEKTLIPKLLGYPADSQFYVDWSPNEFQFGGRTSLRAVSMKSFLAGYLYQRLIRERRQIVFLTPQEVRAALGFPKNLKKELVHVRFVQEFRLPDSITRNFTNWSPDSRDAYILAYVGGLLEEDD
ncbi:MAG TPA: hypothetical protein PLD15_06220 [Mesotoga sp.]|nr:hypothetical protein [Mesotoga sp.]